MTLEAQAPLTSRIIETRSICWRNMEFIQQDDFKDLSKEAMGKLKTSILQNQFTAPFYAWEDPEGTIFCLDGKHRTLALEALDKEGYSIPNYLPTTFIDCESKADAAKLVLIYSSIYAKITQQGLFDFIGMYDLEFEDLKRQMDIPDFSVDRFEQKFDIFGTKEEDEPCVDVLPEKIIVKLGDAFELNGHRIVCGTLTSDEDVALLMGGEKARIVNCDPPYNLPASFFANERHEDFAMAVGEMSDEEFVQFLALVMQRSIDNTVPGAIHYLFMDHRHVWHMTEAGRRIYGKPAPKQLCTWVKDTMANGAFYRPQQELCFVFSDEKAKALWNKDLLDEGGFYKTESELCFVFKNGDGAKHLSHLEMQHRIRTNVWRYPAGNSMKNPDRDQLKNHPTPKPVAMIADAILDTTNPDDLVIDWFLGSGTCLIACAQTGRRGRFTDIDPMYVQGSILRYLVWAKRNNVKVEFRHLNGESTEADFRVMLPAEK